MKNHTSTLKHNQTPAAENIHGVERVVRILTAAAMIAPIFFLTGTIGWEAYFALGSVYFALTGLTGFDPLYAWFDARIARRSESRETTRQHISHQTLSA